MTAFSHAEDLRVVHSEPATWESNLPHVSGVLPAANVTRRVWSSGDVTFGCDICSRDFSSAQGALQHIGWSHNRKSKLRVVDETTPASEPTVSGLAADIERLVGSQILDTERTIQKLQDERDDWRARAKDAEKRLSSLRKALQA